jgi:hypothetical protein
VALLTPTQASAKVEELVGLLAKRRPDAEQWMRYYRGTQGALLFASDDFREACGNRFDNFSDNWCAPVAQAGAERLQVLGINLPGSKPGELSDAENSIHGAWMDNDFEALLAGAFVNMVVQRRSYVSVWGDTSGAPLMAVEPAEQAIVEYEPESRSRRRYGLKAWADDTYEYANLMAPDFVYKFRRPAVRNGLRPSGIYVAGILSIGGWEPLGDPVPNKLGAVPLVELPYLPPVQGEPLSRISGVAAMQDAANLLWAYLFNSADYASMPARVVMGQSPPKVPVLDENGQKVGDREIDIEEIVRGRILWLTGTDAKVGQWDAATLEPFGAVIERIVGHLMSQTRTPPYYFANAGAGINNIGADGIKALDTSLVEQLRTQKTHLNGRIRDIADLTARQLGLGDVGAKRGNVRWASIENRSDTAKADAFLKNRQAGYPFEWLLMEDGRSPDEIALIMQMKADEDERAKSDPATEAVINKLLNDNGDTAGEGGNGGVTDDGNAA